MTREVAARPTEGGTGPANHFGPTFDSCRADAMEVTAGHSGSEPFPHL